jgi:hypothetical protein
MPSDAGMETREYTYKQGAEQEDIHLDVHLKKGLPHELPSGGRPVGALNDMLTRNS